MNSGADEEFHCLVCRPCAAASEFFRRRRAICTATACSWTDTDISDPVWASGHSGTQPSQSRRNVIVAHNLNVFQNSPPSSELPILAPWPHLLCVTRSRHGSVAECCLCTSCWCPLFRFCRCNVAKNVQNKKMKAEAYPNF